MGCPSRTHHLVHPVLLSTDVHDKMLRAKDRPGVSPGETRKNVDVKLPLSPSPKKILVAVLNWLMSQFSKIMTLRTSVQMPVSVGASRLAMNSGWIPVAWNVESPAVQADCIRVSVSSGADV